MLPKNNVAFASRNTTSNGCVDAHAVVAKWRAFPLPAENWPPTKQLKGVSLPLGQQSNEANHSFPRVGVISAWHERLRLLPWKEKQAPGHARVRALRPRLCAHLRPRWSGFLRLWRHAGHGDHAANGSAGANGDSLKRLRMCAVIVSVNSSSRCLEQNQNHWCKLAKPGGCNPRALSIRYFFFPSSSPVSSTARKAFCGMSTEPIDFIRFLPAFCFSQSLRLRLMSPP